MIEFPNLLCITRDSSELSHAEQVNILIQKGARFIQIRSKFLSHSELEDQVKEATKATAQKDVILIINDYIDIARIIGIDGVHLGKKDDSSLFARKTLGGNKFIGSTVHNFEEAKKVKLDGVANYVGLGPYRLSKTKFDLTPILSEAEINNIVNLLSPVPVFLIGGIDLPDCNLISKFNLRGIAVCAALSNNNLYGENVSRFNQVINKNKLLAV